ncbi:hypothetical protein [Crassaminicella profunda]|uniref:hypothetical protein n=1 Tax=Crassaminicella profunda TaxID=1286698 RepID=UPI001CA7135B|nr:hypothetical protein [Crassaminicella profunda]QZY57316.1 hypothetical protein K7H06_10505 [Crassaminicella profunda]
MKTPGLWNWSKDEKCAKVVLKDKLKSSSKELCPWEKKVIRWFTLLTMIAGILYALWDFFNNTYF